MTDKMLKEIAQKAATIIYGNEGGYGSVNANDNGAVSVGKVQWHGSRALDLLKTIIAKLGQSQSENILGAALHKEIKTAIQWNARIVTVAEKNKLTALLTTPAGRNAQDELAEKDVLSYVEHGVGMGLAEPQALIYFADLENQGGAGASARVTKTAVTRAGAAQNVTLMILHETALNDRVMGKYKTRRNETYKKAAAAFKATEQGTGGNKMAVKLSNCGHDENGRYAGGKAGDQTGTEYQIIDWYSRPWKCVLRFENETVATMIADMAKKAALNDLIGYDQGTVGNSNDRYTFWQHLKASNYDPAQITIACESDCSASTAAIIKGAGYRLGIQALQNVSIYLTTYDMRNALRAAGAKVLTESKYLTSGNYIKAGDILLNDDHHVAIAITSGLHAGNTTTETTTNTGGTKKSVTEIAKEVLAGKWGNGDERKNRLTSAGYNYNEVQKKVNELATGTAKKSVTEIAKEVIAGKWGNGDARKSKLTSAGYDYNAVQKEVNRLLK